MVALPNGVIVIIVKQNRGRGLPMTKLGEEPEAARFMARTRDQDAALWQKIW